MVSTLGSSKALGEESAWTLNISVSFQSAIMPFLAGKTVPHSVDSALVARVESRSRVGRIGDVAVNGVRHLVAQNREFVKLQTSLVFSVDALVSKETGSGDLHQHQWLALGDQIVHNSIATYHVGGHAVTNEEDDVLGPLLGVEVADNPLGGGLLAIVVVQGDGVSARLVEGNLTVRLGGDVDNGGLVGVLSKEVLIPVECPLLERRLLDVKGFGKVLGLAAVLGDGHLELLVGLAVVGGLGAIDGSVNLDTQIKQLTREEVALVGRQNTSQGRACSQALEGLGRDAR